MITVTIFKNNQGIYKRFFCNGHAEFAYSGKDIVCAAVSVLVINTIHSIETLTGEPFELKTAEKTGEIDFLLKASPSKETKLLLDSMVLGLKEIEQQYGKRYVKLKFEEV